MPSVCRTEFGFPMQCYNQMSTYHPRAQIMILYNCTEFGVRFEELTNKISMVTICQSVFCHRIRCYFSICN
uniref:Uncharacterized protein n=1 Tax=Arundo donax TaxID=35708 RepID=A0A0A9E1T6_ARUDO